MHTGNAALWFNSLLFFVSLRLAWFRWVMRLCLSSLFARNVSLSPARNTKSSDKNVLLTKHPGPYVMAQNPAESFKVSSLFGMAFSVFNRGPIYSGILLLQFCHHYIFFSFQCECSIFDSLNNGKQCGQLQTQIPV